MRLITSSLMAGVLALSAAAPAFADPPRGHNDRGHNDRDRNDRGRNDRDWRNDRGHNDRDWRNDRWNGRGWYDNSSNHHDWRRGDRFDRNYYSSRFYVVNNYRDYRLPQPRYGEYYYRDNRTGEILLIAAATGLVLWALNN